MDEHRLDPILGDPAIVRDLSALQVKGSLLAARSRWVREQHGEAALEALVDAVPEGPRRFLVEPPLPFAWYPFEPMLTIDHAIITGPLAGDATKIYDFGDAIARYDLSTLYKVLFKLGSPAFIIRRIGIVYAQYLRPGRASAVSDTPGAATVTVSGARFPFYFCAYGISGWLNAAIELSGGENVRVEQTECVHHGEPHCRYALRWS